MNEGNDALDKKEQRNLWTSIWLEPRETVRYAIDHKTMKYAIMLVIIAGLFDVLNAATQNNLGATFTSPSFFIWLIVLSPVLGLIGWWIGAGIATMVGTWFGGTGTFAELKMAFAISYIPVILGGLIWIPDLLILGKSLFVEDFTVSGWRLIWQFFSGFVGIVLGIWSFIITVMVVAEAHRISGWRGFWTVVIPGVLLVIVLSIFFLPFFFLLF
ncbi:Yip1 family protein [Sporosarcina sp. YIM B06819]|uniref:Yip1 family protein n=1 Tax=Sporosarcina sp. YIM B06819 TaxID=3081769 RepID=UPI00298BF919|nr:Yip1 family protein [Sporosarcina sp. YIM B06819]